MSWSREKVQETLYQIMHHDNCDIELTPNQNHPLNNTLENFDELKTSVGIAVQWLAPLGLFRFSYALPLNEFKGNDRFYGDRIERFQFSIGQAF